MWGLVWLHTVMSITIALVIHNEMYMKNVLITGYKHIFKYFTILKHDHPPPFFFPKNQNIQSLPVSISVQILPFHTCSELSLCWLLDCLWLFDVVDCHRSIFLKILRKKQFVSLNATPPPIKLKDVFPLRYHSIKYLHAM